MISIKDYYNGNGNKILDKLYQDILSDPHYFKTHDINQVNEENYTLLGLAWALNHPKLVNILIDAGADINHVNDREQLIAINFIDKDLFKVLNSPQLRVKNKLFEQLTLNSDNHIFYKDKEFFSEFLNHMKDDLKTIPYIALLNFEKNINFSSKEELLPVWNKFKEENNISISNYDIIDYLVQQIKINEPYIFNSKEEFDKTEYYKIQKENDYNFFAKLPLLKNKPVELIQFINEFLSTEPESKYKKNYTNQTRINRNICYFLLSVILKIQTKPKYIEDGNFYEDFKNQYNLQIQLYEPVHKNLEPLLEKYGLVSISVDKKYNLNLIYEFLDDKLDGICKVFDIKNENLGANNLSINLERMSPFKAKGLMTLSSSSQKEREKNKHIVIRLNRSLDTYLSVKSPLALKIVSERKMAINSQPHYDLFNQDSLSTMCHEYTHFLQHMNGKNIFIGNYRKQWNDIKKDLKEHQNAKECIEYIINRFDLKINEKIENLYMKDILDNLFYSKNNEIYKDSRNKFKRYLNENKQDIEMPFNIISAYRYQNKSSFQKELWKYMDRGKKYLNEDHEIHSRLVQEVFIPDENNYSFYFINPINIEKKKEIKEKLKYKLKAFNSMLTTQVEIYIGEDLKKSKLKLF